MSRIEFVVPGVPQSSHIQRVRPWQESVQWCWQAQTGRARVSGSALLFADFFLPRPKYMNTGRYPDGLVEHTTKPDLGELLKGLVDALNGHAWDNDTQVCGMTARKSYCEKGGSPRVHVTLMKPEDAA